MQTSDIKIYLNEEQIQNILEFINQNFIDRDKYKTQLENSSKLAHAGESNTTLFSLAP